MKVACVDCGKEFNFLDLDKADEVLIEHDCEAY